MGQFLIDTNVVIDYLARRFPVQGSQFMDDLVNERCNLSVITKIEVLGFNASETHFNLLSDFMNDAKIFHLTDKVVDVCINLRQRYKIKLPDAIIAATALCHDLTLITRNTSDFARIQDLTLLDLHKL